MRVNLNFMNVKIEDIECDECKNIYTIDEMIVERLNACLTTTCQVCMNDNYINVNVDIKSQEKTMSIEDELECLQEDRNKKLTEIEELEEKTEDLHEKINELREDRNKKVAETEDLEAETEELHEKIEELEAETEDLKCEVAEIEEKIEELEANIVNLH